MFFLPPSLARPLLQSQTGAGRGDIRPCPCLRGERSVSPLRSLLAGGFFVDALYQGVGSPPFCASLADFIVSEHRIISGAFSTSVDTLRWFFVRGLDSQQAVLHLLILHMEPASRPGINSIWLWRTFTYTSDSVYGYFLEDFCICV